jgi:hypothetical protein
MHGGVWVIIQFKEWEQHILVFHDELLEIDAPHWYLLKITETTCFDMRYHVYL